jgi:putative metallopeptidase DUF4344
MRALVTWGVMLALLRVAHADWDVQPSAKVDTTVRRDKASVPKADARQADAGGFKEVGLRVVYMKSKDPGHEKFRDFIEKAGTFDEMSIALNRVFRFPQLVTIQWVDCGMVNAFWDGHDRIVMCYELMDQLADLFSKKLKDKEQLKAAVMSAMFFTFFHELGHGAIAMFKLPAVGREEDAVDQLAALVLLKAGPKGPAMAILGAEFFHLWAESGSKTPYFDEHSLDDQRFYNVMCLVYGSDPSKFGQMIGPKGLPESRARRCQGEYTKISAAWDTLLKGHWRGFNSEEAKTSSATSGTCDGAAIHTMRLLAERIKIELKDVPADRRNAAIEMAKTRMSQAAEQLRDTCLAKPWPRESIACVENAVSLTALDRCQIPR